MPATRFKIWDWGPPVGRGAMSSVRIGVAGIAKCSNAALPYAVGAELICGNLARALLLPVPPSFIVANDSGVPYHVSLHHSLAGEALPPADAALLTQQRPVEACGAILFDLWVGNTDRHPGNLAYFEDESKVMLFDHSHAFMPGPDGLGWLQTNRDVSNLVGECLVPHLSSLVSVPHWLGRINEVPTFFIRELVRSAADVGITADIVDPLFDYLDYRRGHLLELLKKSKGLFTGLPVDAWNSI